MCRHPISKRYPLVELFTGIISAFLAWHFGIGHQLWAALLFTYALIAMVMIDIDEQLLPDVITLPLLWIGLLLNTYHIFTDLNSAVIGAIAGYSSLWLFTKIYYLLTNKLGMGNGDFKLLAMFGAWLGWQLLPFIIICSTMVGAVFGITLIISKQASRNTAIPFGPYLATAGWIALIWGNTINQLYIQYAFK